jgi:hypothetical protein
MCHFIYRLKLYALFNNDENETALNRQWLLRQVWLYDVQMQSDAQTSLKKSIKNWMENINHSYRISSYRCPRGKCIFKIGRQLEKRNSDFIGVRWG